MAGKKHRPKSELERLIEFYLKLGASPEEAAKKARVTLMVGANA